MNLSKFPLLIYSLLIVNVALGQNEMEHSNRSQLEEVTIKAYLSEERALTVPASIGILNEEKLNRQPDHSFVSALNTIPGVKMEERSPGSYRLSIRGSLLRSPFGIRDVKIYFDEIPLTDAGGNTYLNAVDVKSIQNIEILKGPDGSLFGANSGGVVRLKPSFNKDSNYLKAGLNIGSYSLVHQHADLQQNWSKNQLNINQSYQQYNGYRENSSMRRYYFQLVNNWKVSRNNDLKILALYSDLFYQTPGGLTGSQLKQNPRSARHATPLFPGAVDQKIAIQTKLFLIGAVNEFKISNRIKNVSTIFGNRVDFSNPFITNYEKRKENTYGLRSYFELTNFSHKNISWKLNVGLEWQQTNSVIGNYGNVKGIKDSIQSLDNINTNQHFIFARYSLELLRNLHVEAAMSLNFYSYRFKNIFPLAQKDFSYREFPSQLMPRLAFSYELYKNFIWRASVSRGYSTPTIAEVRPTDNMINTRLNAEYGWSYETGFRLQNENADFSADVSVFYYKLQNAIVRRLNPDETEYYINAGGTHQPGLEFTFMWWFIKPNKNHFIRGAQLNESFSYNKFSFSNYSVSNNDFSGNQLTGVPSNVSILGLQLDFPESFSFFLQHNYTSRTPLNDDNTVYADFYHLLQFKVNWKHRFGAKVNTEIYASADNILNENYSLGNDLNAVGGRYFNPAPLRSFTIGFNVVF